MMIVSVSQFLDYLPCLGACLAKCLNSVLYVKALVGAFSKEKALVGAFSTIVKTDGSFTALLFYLRPEVGGGFLLHLKIYC